MRKNAVFVTLFLTLAAGGCWGGSSDRAPGEAGEATAPESVSTAPEAVPAAADDGATPTSTLQERYLEDLCRLYTAPDCVADQKRSCPTHVAFDSASQCVTFLAEQTEACEDLDATLHALGDRLVACREQLKTHTCGSEAFCDDAGTRVDARGACAEVSMRIARACPARDTGF